MAAAKREGNDSQRRGSRQPREKVAATKREGDGSVWERRRRRQLREKKATAAEREGDRSS